MIIIVIGGKMCTPSGGPQSPYSSVRGNCFLSEKIKMIYLEKELNHYLLSERSHQAALPQFICVDLMSLRTFSEELQGF
jgi:hypothetical protein